jgi:hypothetical protein
MKKISGMKKLRLNGAKIKTEPVKTTVKKKKDNSANLGRYLHPAKLPSGSKIGASTTVKMPKQKRLKMRAQKGARLNV